MDTKNKKMGIKKEAFVLSAVLVVVLVFSSFSFILQNGFFDDSSVADVNLCVDGDYSLGATGITVEGIVGIPISIPLPPQWGIYSQPQINAFLSLVGSNATLISATNQYAIIVALAAGRYEVQLVLAANPMDSMAVMLWIDHFSMSIEGGSNILLEAGDVFTIEPVTNAPAIFSFDPAIPVPDWIVIDEESGFPTIFAPFLSYDSIVPIGLLATSSAGTTASALLFVTVLADSGLVGGGDGDGDGDGEDLEDFVDSGIVGLVMVFGVIIIGVLLMAVSFRGGK